MQAVTTVVRAVDRFQQKHPALGFPLALIKKYGDDNGGYLAALITYYGFVSLFPLLLVVVTVLHVIFSNNPDIQQQITQGLNTYFPLLGKDLQANVQSSSKTGLGLVVALLIAIYGARGAADAFRHMLDAIWQVPRERQVGFPKNLLKSLSIMGIGAVGFLATVGVSVFSSTLGHAVWVKILVNVLGFVIVTAALACSMHVGLSRSKPLKQLLLGSAIGGLIIQLLITFGALLVAHQLKNLDTLYGTFAIVLGLLFWIYLLAQVLVYAAQIDTIRVMRLWPRALDSSQATAADKQAYRLYAKAEQYIPPEEVDVHFAKKQPKKSGAS